MILIIDNYDSFTYNLYQGFGTVTPDIEVVYNDQINVEEIEHLKPSHIVISPGPGRPKDAGICESVVKYFAGKCPILGICLGHQAIGETFGGEITYARQIIHGKKSTVHIANGSPIFRGLAPVLEVGRYHSLLVERKTLPEELLVIAETKEGEIMGMKHRDFDVFGLQFHPESILTKEGGKILENFLKIGGNDNDRSSNS